jgi:UDP-N-acetylmuramoyl-L-alanyl-D-glutamate--2,6-diaminopimelate ligase
MQTCPVLLSSLLPGAERRGDAEVTGLAYSDRSVQPGDLFCCWPGLVHDGHDFAPAAKEKGAAALVVERFLDVDLPQARVGSVRDAMGPLADLFFGRPSSAVPVAAVTGTNGKTTVTYFLEATARAAGREPGVIGTVSRRWRGHEDAATRTTPEAIDLQRLLRQMVDDGVDFVAMEAASDGLAQGRLRGTSFVSAGFTNLSPDHLITHGTMDAYFEAKALLFDGSYTTSAVINADDPYGRKLIDRVTFDVLTFGNDADLTFHGEVTADGIDGTVQTPSGPIALRSPLVGRHNVENALCAIGLALRCGFEPAAITAGIAAMDQVPGRLERVDAAQPFLAVVDYAHTPDALDHAVRTCRELTSGKLIVVFGCGGDRDRAKRPLMGEAVTRVADLTIITSDNPRSEEPAAIIAEIEPGAKRGGGVFESIVDRTEAIRRAVSVAQRGDVVLVAGKGHEQGQQFADRTVPFDDRLVLREAIEELACPS